MYNENSFFKIARQLCAFYIPPSPSPLEYIPYLTRDYITVCVNNVNMAGNKENYLLLKMASSNLLC